MLSWSYFLLFYLSDFNQKLFNEDFVHWKSREQVANKCDENQTAYDDNGISNLINTDNGVILKPSYMMLMSYN